MGQRPAKKTVPALSDSFGVSCVKCTVNKTLVRVGLPLHPPRVCPHRRMPAKSKVTSPGGPRQHPSPRTKEAGLPLRGDRAAESPTMSRKPVLCRPTAPSTDLRGELGLENFLARQASHSFKRKRNSAFAHGSLSSPSCFPLITGKRRGVSGGGAGRQQQGREHPPQGSQHRQSPVGDEQLAGEALGDIPGRARSRPVLPAPTRGSLLGAPCRG